MKISFEISNGVKTYKLISIGDDIFIENEKEEAMTMPEAELFCIIDEYFQEQF